MTAQKAGSKHYTPADVFYVTGVPVAKQNQWYDRGTIIPARLDTKPNGSGIYRMVCAATVLQFATTTECVRTGLPAKLAAEGARLIAVAQPGRQANDLFECGHTLLLFQKNGSRIVSVQYDESLTDFCGREFDTATIVNIAKIKRAVDEKLISIKKGKNK
jgi:hypothetical protein